MTLLWTAALVAGLVDGEFGEALELLVPLAMAAFLWWACALAWGAVLRRRRGRRL